VQSLNHKQATKAVKAVKDLLMDHPDKPHADLIVEARIKAKDKES
jgi:hypothetical protein